MHAFVFWADVLMIPWKMMMSPVADSLNAAAAATSPAATGWATSAASILHLGSRDVNCSVVRPNPFGTTCYTM